VIRFLRFRFTLMTLLLAIAWSAAAMRINVTSLEEHFPSMPNQWGDIRGPSTFRYYGWPFICYASEDVIGRTTRRYYDYWKLAGDAAVGVLLVVVLTWGSNQLFCRVGARLRRCTVSCLNKQQPADSQVE
jgi:hypothetical protein